MNLLKKLSHTSYGSDRHTLLKLYRTLIRPVLDYGCSIYTYAPENRLSRLNTIQNTAVRISTGAFRTTPTVSLLNDASECPLDIRRQYISTSTYLNIKSNPDFNLKLEYMIPMHSLSVKFQSFLQQVEENNIKIHHLLVNPTPPWQSFNPIIDLSLTEFNKNLTNPIILKRHFLLLLDKYKEYSHIYTDGSKTKQFTGCAIIHDDISIPIALPSLCTILTAELYAIKSAITYSLDFSLNKVTVFTDSLSALLSIKNYRSKYSHPISLEIIELLQLFQNSTPILGWIPSHSQIHGNELADKIAKQAHLHLPLANIPIPLSDLKLHSKTLMHEVFQFSWSLIPSSNKLKRIKNTTSLWKTSEQLQRRSEVLLTRLRTGHSLLTHQFIFLKQPPPSCPECNIPLNIAHLLIDCPSYQNERSRLLNSNQLQVLLSDDPTHIDNVIKFLYSTKLDKKI
ncbi:uncharacterized protein LOC135840786 [Planococcus citri]|uniref:uncharacterized protein LOC135840786 n=1 Tax=Planococcus citri TaxID=170843 RepID=UPI0031F7B3B3